MKYISKTYCFFLFVSLAFSNNLRAQCHYIPSTSSSIDTLSYTFSGGIFASYGCAPIDPTFWLSGNGTYVIATFVNPESYPSFRVWGMNDDDSAAVEVNGASYPLDQSTAYFDPKVICGISPGPDGVIFSNGKVVGANSNAMGNYSYQDITINATNVLTLKVTGTNGAGWGFAGITVDCIQLPVAAIAVNPVSICPGTCIGFTNLSVNATQYEWFFPGANPSADTAFNPSGICYSSPGSYDVTLIATNPTGSDTLSLPDYVTVYPYPAPQGIQQNGDTLVANTGAVTYQWYYSGNIIPGATDYYYLASMSGNYNVVATDSNGCEVEAAIFDVIADFPSTRIIRGDVAVFPNPAGNLVQVASSHFTETEVAIFNLSGVRVAESSFPADLTSNLEIDVSKLLPGCYYLQLKAGEKTMYARFIKQ